MMIYLLATYHLHPMLKVTKAVNEDHRVYPVLQVCGPDLQFITNFLYIMLLHLIKCYITCVGTE